MKTELPFILAALALPSFSQTHQNAAGSKPVVSPIAVEAQAAPEIPIYNLEFKQADPVPGLPVSSSVLVMEPTECTSDGALFLDMPKPPTLMEQTIYSLQPGKSHTFSPAAITDLHDVSMVSFFPSSSIVGFLVRATKETEKVQDTFIRPDGKASVEEVNRGKHHFYIAKFDLNGNYKESVELPLTYQLYHFAILPSGNFIVSGYDSANNTPRLVLLDSGGAVIRPIELPDAIQRYDPLQGHDNVGAMMNVALKFGMINFTSYGDNVLVWRANTRDPVVVVGEGGRLNEVPIAYPKDYVLADIVPSNDRWVVHLNPGNLPGDVAHDLKSTAYYDVRPSDGSLLRKLNQPGTIQNSIACEHDGTYISYAPDKDGNLRLLTAN